MTPRLMQAALVLALSACGGSPTATAQDNSTLPESTSGERPFSVTPVADFDTPWAMTFQAQAQVALRGEVKGFIHGPTNDLVVYRDVTKN